ncbi:MAG TPA: hypothetical protein VFS55_04950 [Dokdonella sp.]|nr:hypothetical protein [Dokdonella sp.]
MSLSRWTLHGAAALLVALPTLGHALTTRCVATPEALVSAFDDAMASSDPIFIIKLRQGQFTLDSVSLPLLELTRSNQTVEISGGWVDAGCQDRALGHDHTLLAGNSTDKTFSFNAHANSGGLLYVHDLSISSANGTTVGNGACLLGWLSAGHNVTFDRVRLTQCKGGIDSSAASGELNNNGGELVVRNVVVDTGIADYNGGLSVYTRNAGVTRIAHISVTNTHSTAPAATASGLLLTTLDGSRTDVGNSVIWGNDTGLPDLSVSGAFNYLTRVHRTLLDGTPTSDITPGTGDPGFVSIGNPRLRADSILIDSGVSNPSGGSGTYDADGRARVSGAAPDVGAFEWTPGDVIFADGLD